MKKSSKFIWITIIILVVLVLWFKRQMDHSWDSYQMPGAPALPVEKPVAATTTKPTPVTVVKQPTFTWSFRKTPRGDIAMTEITLTATYPDGAKIAKIIETIEGGCNEYSSPDKDVYAKSKMIMCYYAGIGRYYKVVKDNTGYAVMRKEFEEASPDYNPPVQEFKEVNRF